MARAEATKSDLPIEIATLAELSVDELRRYWTQMYGLKPVPRISRELLIRGVAYRMQEIAKRGISRQTARKLEQLAQEMTSSGSVAIGRRPTIRPGTRLIREWQGRVIEVVVLEDQYLWRGTRYRSLSEIARLITGTRWSGPRFFGTLATEARSKLSGTDHD